ALVAGVAVAAAVEEETGLRPGIKWPNDVLLGGRKVAGILVEMESEVERVHHVIAGIGVNLNAPRTAFPPALRPKAGRPPRATGRRRGAAGRRRGDGVGRAPLMLLAIDVSNTHTKVGVYEGDRLARHWRLQTEPERTADEYGVMLLGLFRTGGVSPEDVTGIAVSSVVPPMHEMLDEL